MKKYKYKNPLEVPTDLINEIVDIKTQIKLLEKNYSDLLLNERIILQKIHSKLSNQKYSSIVCPSCVKSAIGVLKLIHHKP